MAGRRLARFLVASLFALATASAQSAELITDGGFEGGGIGWTVSSARVTFTDVSDYNACCSPTGIYPYGLKVATFGSNDIPGGSIFQDINTLAGEMYTLTFAYGAISETRLQRMRASILNVAGLVPLSTIELFTFGTTQLDAMMNTAMITFQAQSNLTRIAFTDISPSTASVDGFIDNVSVLGPVPEPSTYALMLVGLGALALAARRRRREAQNA